MLCSSCVSKSQVTIAFVTQVVVNQTKLNAGSKKLCSCWKDWADFCFYFQTKLLHSRFMVLIQVLFFFFFRLFPFSGCHIKFSLNDPAILLFYENCESVAVISPTVRVAESHEQFKVTLWITSMYLRAPFQPSSFPKVSKILLAHWVLWKKQELRITVVQWITRSVSTVIAFHVLKSE